MRPDPRVLLTDIDQAGADIEHFIKGMDVGAYAGSALTQAAVERKFEIIGEALNRLQRTHPDLAERIPRHRRIKDFRNAPYQGANLPRVRISKKTVYSNRKLHISAD